MIIYAQQKTEGDPADDAKAFVDPEKKLIPRKRLFRVPWTSSPR